VSVSGKLGFALETGRKVFHEYGGILGITIAEMPRGNELDVGAYGCERPNITVTPLAFLVFGNVLRLGIAEGLYLITLNALAWEIAKNLILILITSPAYQLKELDNGVFSNTSHSDSCSDGIAPNQSCNHLFLFLNFNLSIMTLMFERYSFCKQINLIIVIFSDTNICKHNTNQIL